MKSQKGILLKSIVSLIVILLISGIFISIVSADSEIRISEKKTSRLENAKNILLSKKAFEYIGKELKSNKEFKYYGYVPTGAELLDIVIKVNTSINETDYNKFINFLKQSDIKIKQQFNETGLIMVKVPANKVDEVANLDTVEVMDFEAKYYPEKSIQPALETGSSWGVSKINANLLWQKGFKGDGITVAVVDTGIDEDHPALNGKIVDHIDTAPDDEDGNDPIDHAGHGTHVAGTIGASQYNGDIGTFVGVAPDVKILNAKVFSWEDGMQGPIDSLSAYPINGWIPGTISQGERKEYKFRSSTNWSKIYKIKIVLTYGALGSGSNDDINIELYNSNGDFVASSQAGVSITPKVIEYSGSEYKLQGDNRDNWSVVVVGSQVDNLLGIEPFEVDIQTWYNLAYDGDIGEGIKWAYDTANPRADIISISISSGDFPIWDTSLSAFARETKNAIQKGIPVVKSAGNDGPRPDTITLGSAINEIITVGSINIINDVSDFSSRGGNGLISSGYKPDVVAPGEAIPSSFTLHSWSGERRDSVNMWGTSMATPHVSGAIALLMQAYIETYGRKPTPQEVKALLMGTAVDTTLNLKLNKDYDYGAGLIDVYRAYLGFVSSDLNTQPSAGTELDEVFVKVPANKHQNDNFLKGTLYWDDSDDTFSLRLRNTDNSETSGTAYGSTMMVSNNNPNSGIYDFKIEGLLFPLELIHEEQWYLVTTYPITQQLSAGADKGFPPYTETLGMINNTELKKYYIDIPNNAGYLRSVIYWTTSVNNLDLYLYDPNNNLIDYSNLNGVSAEQIGTASPVAGRWRLEVKGTAVTGSQSFSILSNYGLIEPVFRSGGPDHFGYTFKDSNAPNGPAYEWIDITSSGTMILDSSDDSYVDGIPVGFFFNFYGTDYSHVSITNNGLTLASGGTWEYRNQPIGSSGSHNLIAPFWDDLVTWYSAGAVYYQTIGTAPNRKFIVEWFDNQGYSSTPSGITFEAILYEGTNDIKFQYKDTDFGSGYYNKGTSATVGIEGSDGRGLQYSFNEPVIDPGLAILFKFPAFSGTNMYLTKNAPASMDHGNTMTYTLYFNNFGSVFASNVVLQDTLPSNVEFISASDGGTYDPATRKITWNMGLVAAFPAGRGSRTVTVRIPGSVPVGTIIQNTASISTSTLETRYDDNSAVASTTVTGSSLPPDVSVGPTNGNTGGTPSVYWGTPVTFTYYSSCATNAGINIHINDGGSDITGSMLETSPDTWTYTTTFYPRHGATTVTYTISGCATPTVAFNIYIDPAGYIYDINTGARISGATVWLQRPDGSGGWENVPTGQTPAISQPDVNPLITGADGQYQWDVLEGSYRVHVEAPGYYPADSIAVSIPPPVTDLHVGLISSGDTIPPATTATLIGSPGNNGWYISDVQVNLAATDNEGGSGVNRIIYSFDNSNWITYMTPVLIDNEGTTTIYYGSTDNAGNVEPTRVQTVNIDKTQPQVTIGVPADGSLFILNQSLIANWSVHDSLSGIATATGTVPDGSTINTDAAGTKIFSVIAADNAGNIRVQNATYAIVYDFLSILPPVKTDNSSIFKSGSTVPVKFRIADANGNYVSTAVANLTYQKITDDILGTLEEPFSTSQANEGNTFRYDSTDNLYIFNLGTSDMAKGTYQLNIYLDDGTVHTVRISIKQ